MIISGPGEINATKISLGRQSSQRHGERTLFIATDPHRHTRTLLHFFNRSRLLILRKTKTIMEWYNGKRIIRASDD